MAEVFYGAVVLFTESVTDPAYGYPGEFDEEAVARNLRFCARFGIAENQVYDVHNDTDEMEEIMETEDLWPSLRYAPKMAGSYEGWRNSLAEDRRVPDISFRPGEMIYVAAVRLGSKMAQLRLFSPKLTDAMVIQVPRTSIEVFERVGGPMNYVDVPWRARVAIEASASTILPR